MIEDLFFTAHLTPKQTGLSHVLWFSQKGDLHHDVRVWLSRGPKALPSVSVAIRPNIHIVEGELSGSDLALLKEWIEINRPVLVRYWESEIQATSEAIAALKP